MGRRLPLRLAPLVLLGCTTAGVVSEEGVRPVDTSSTSTSVASGTGSTTSPGTTASTSTTPPVEVDCHAGWNVPPTDQPGWAPILSNTGPDTLTVDPSHSHDDGLGPIGWCPSEDTAGSYLALVAARFETDQVPPYAPCVVDPWAPDPTHDTYGACASGGNHNVYVEILDADGQRVAGSFDLWWPEGSTRIDDQDKPPNEFPMNGALWGGGQYGVTPIYGDLRAESVTNLRIPINHHVNYLLTFQVVP